MASVSILMLEMAEPMNSVEPTGGVSRPMPRFSTITMPRWIGDSPIWIQIGSMTGVSIRIRQAISIRQPSISISTFSMMRISILLLVSVNRPVATFSGIFR